MGEFRPEFRITVQSDDGRTAVVLQCGYYKQPEPLMVRTPEDGKWFKSGPSRLIMEDGRDVYASDESGIFIIDGVKYREVRREPV
jgi:hypothetical protein